MCGRYTVTATAAVLETRFGAKMDIDDYQPRFNVAPSQSLPVILHRASDRIVAGRWGFRPQWAKGKPEIKPQINARAETAINKPMFRSAFKTQRCLILADGFYEWHQTSGMKVPYRITLTDKQPFAIAGLWSEVATYDERPVITFTILTVCANECMSAIHSRMPVILSQADQERWLDLSQPTRKATSMLVPYPTALTRLHPVSKAVNNARHDYPELVQPV